jgi:uncharacterized membrane protein
MRFLSRVFFQGLLTVLPIALTVFVLFWLSSMAEAVLGPLLRLGLTDAHYLPGMGLTAGVVLIFLVGLMVNTWGISQLIGWGERRLNRLPLVKFIYGPMRDLMQFFSSSKELMGQVVMVRLGQSEMRLLGFVTRKDFTNLPEGIGGNGKVAVYLPMSFQLGGFTVMLPKEAIEPVDMSIEEAMKFALTGGVTTRD